MPDRIEIRIWKSTEVPRDWVGRKRKIDSEYKENLEKSVKEIIDAVKKRGNGAVFEYTQKFDGVTLTSKTLKVTPGEIKKAYESVAIDQINALELIKGKLEFLEKQTKRKQLAKTIREGIKVETALYPLDSVGCYVPGGRAAYPSTLIMTVTPAKVAGVPRIVVCSPPTEKGTINPLILVAADICGVNEIYRIGGVQAVAALAYGTETITPVRKIVGPGSKYVTMAKILASRNVAIDMPAGPSEVLILADETTSPRFVAADMISQAEHGADSVAGLITTSNSICEEVVKSLKEISEGIAREDIVRQSLSTLGFIIVCKTPEEMVNLANMIAPEHLEILTENPMRIAAKITTAGLILIGPNSPVALSDYCSGTNHVLPTGGYGRTYSGLSVLDFSRRVSVVESTKEGLKSVKNAIKTITEAEHLPNHYKAVEARFEK
jgi:histidinol dehydrogenase